LDILKGCRNERQLKKALKELPKTLYATYDRILGNINADDFEFAYAALQWLVVSQRPLYLEEVAEAAVLEPGRELDTGERLTPPEDILEICSSLITSVTTTVGGRKRVEIRFAHSSVKEYLVSNVIKRHKFFISEPDAQEAIAIHCLSYIRMLRNLPSISEETTEDFPLLRYAAKYWPEHVLRVRNSRGLSAELEDLVFEILGPQEPPYFRHWLCIYDPDQPWRDEELGTDLCNLPSSLYYGASFGMAEVVKFLLDEGVDADTIGGQYGSALQVAAWLGHEEIVRILLKHGAKLDAQGGHQGCAIHMAAAKGNSEVVKLLLEHGADAHAPSGHYGSVLHAAAENGQFETVQLLLTQPDIKPNAGDRSGRTPLFLAAYNGYAKVVELLLGKGEVEPDLRDDSGYSPLWWAAQNGHEEVVKLLLGRNVRPDCKSPVGRTPLSFAAQNGHIEVVRLLLDREDVDPNFGDECNITPLTRAAQSGHTVIAKMLLERGADPDPKGMYGETPLAGACQYGHVAVVKLLLERHVDKEFKDAYGQTALDHAVANKHEVLIQLLGGDGILPAEARIEPSDDPPPYAESEVVDYPLEGDIGDENKASDEQPSVAVLALDGDLQVSLRKFTYISSS
jgi:ankyrin repeat protein